GVRSIDDTGEASENEQDQPRDEIGKKEPAFIQVRKPEHPSEPAFGSSLLSGIFQRCGQRKRGNKAGNSDTEGDHAMEKFYSLADTGVAELVVNSYGYGENQEKKKGSSSGQVGVEFSAGQLGQHHIEHDIGR